MAVLKVFIASSSEGLGVVDAVQKLLQRALSGTADVTPWPEGFQLTKTYIDDVQDHETRTAVEASSVVRRMTRSLLRYMLPEVDVDVSKSARKAMYIWNIIAFACLVKFFDPREFANRRCHFPLQTCIFPLEMAALSGPDQ